ncbi:receptor protein kinase FERONIA [Trifolium repens]|nr:receptor protein kinase FERONIA [Trifolium repens]
MANLINKIILGMAYYLKTIVLISELTLLSNILFLLHLFFPLQVVNSFDSLAVNCGHSKDIIFENRNWVGDLDETKLFSIIEPQTELSSVKTKAIPNSDSVNQIPFASARISYSNFTFSFPTSIVAAIGSTVFLRLHFYPTSYQNFETSNALFTVKVGNNITLLKDYNPSVWLRNDNKTITKEYCLTTKPGEMMNITFIPDNTNQSNGYAFINGIEIVSMPPFLYYSAPDYHFNFLTLDGNEYRITNDKALEMVYRVNVGQRQVPPNEDTGMYRNWDTDYPLYLEKEYLNSISSSTHNLNYSQNTTPNYTAPEIVYLTARSYGMYETGDHNVTWNFKVDPAFVYMVRLHFCEINWYIRKRGDRAFQIFIDNNLAEQYADVIRWAGERWVPIYKDYAVEMFSQNGTERVNLSIKLQRAPITTYTVYPDVTLNGIEIFKISDHNNNLAGLSPNKDIILSSPKQLPTQHSKSKKSTKVMVSVVGLSCLLLAFLVGIIFFVRRRRRFVSHLETEGSSWKTKKEGSSSLPPHLCRYFTIAEIRAATNNFDDVFIIGVGGFGNVYKGCIDGSTPVAIKRLKSGSQQGANEFMNEIELLSQLRHIHLLSLVGYCNDDLEMILVYEFMQHGTLCEYLYGSNNQPLPWKQRLEILLGAARGLHYLHAEVKHKIIHRDVKSTNILLDEKWVAKVSDFGLSKVGPTGISTTHVSTMVKGSLGYLDPEYYMFQRLTLKSDVYSFGVVLLEVLCARPPLVRDLDKNTASLVCWFQKCYNEGVAIEQIVDPFLRDSITDECLKSYCKLALSCLHDDGTQRPTMSQVVGDLEFALQLVVSEEGSQFGNAQKEGRYMKGPQFSQFMSDEESDLHFVRSHTYKENTVSAWPSSQEHPFSEIRNPRPRSYSCQNLKVYI